jgi:hypothetical protein
MTEISASMPDSTAFLACRKGKQALVGFSDPLVATNASLDMAFSL